MNNIISFNSYDEENTEWQEFVEDLKSRKIKGITAILINEDDTTSFIINGKSLPQIIVELYYLKRVMEQFIDNEAG